MFHKFLPSHCTTELLQVTENNIHIYNQYTFSFFWENIIKYTFDSQKKKSNVLFVNKFLQIPYGPSFWLFQNLGNDSYQPKPPSKKTNRISNRW